MDHAPEWKKMVHDYETKKSDFNPYAIPVDGKCHIWNLCKSDL
jgi:hypothetical protein